MRVVTILFLVFRSIQCQNTTIENIALKCQTPENEEGFCLPLDECPTLNNKQTNPEFKELLAKSKCNNSSTYCCDIALTPTLKFRMPCKTPDDLDGMCLRIQDCPKLYDALENPKMKRFIKNSQCTVRRPNRKFPIVCCQTENDAPLVVPRLGLFPNTCGTQNIQIRERIFGGTEASIGEFPWMALIVHKKELDRQFGCSGFLISAKFVLTAAHCINGTNELNFGKMIEIVLGEHNRATQYDCDDDKNCALPIQTIKIKKAVSHPLYNENNNHNDIGIIQLAHVANFTKFVQPICMFFTDLPTEYWLSGWGSTPSDRTSAVKLKVDIPSVDIKTCISKYATMNFIVTNNQLCAGGVSGKDSCQGDSGGPLMYMSNNKWYAAGVVSYGVGCGQAGWPGVYTNINSYQEWITNTVAQLNKKNQKKVYK